MVGILQVEEPDFFCRFSEAGTKDGNPIGWVLHLRRGAREALGEAWGSTVEFFTMKEDGWEPLPYNWEPT